MAEQIKLVRVEDLNDTPVDSLDLLANADGITLERGQWVPKFGERDLVTEVMGLTVKDTSHDGLASKLLGLEAKLQQIDQFIQSASERYHIVLRDQASGETGARQSPVLGYSVEPGATLHAPNYVAEKYRLGLDRAPWWEAIALSSPVYLNAISYLGGQAALASIGGSLPARIAEMSINQSSAAEPTEIWLGIRTHRFGDADDFTSFLEAEVTTQGLGTDTSLATDATASPGGAGDTKVTCSFATNAAMVVRQYFWLGDHVADVTEMRGTFDVVARLKVGASTVCTVRLDNGFYAESFTEAQRGENVTVDSATWKFYNLGRVAFPPVGRGPVDMTSCAMRLLAERVSGSNGLDIDGAALVPVDEGYLHVSDAIVSSGPGYSEAAQVRIGPLEDVIGLNKRTFGPLIFTLGMLDVSGVSADMWHLPNGSAGFLIVVANTAAPALTDVLSVTLKYYTRYKTMRGST